MKFLRRHASSLVLALVLGTAVLSCGMPAGASTGSSESDRLVEKARELLKEGDAKAALIQLKNAIRRNPSHAGARFELGLLELRMNDMGAAERDLGQARINNYPASQVGPLLATAQLGQGKYQQILDTPDPCGDEAACQTDMAALRARAYLGLGDMTAADKESQSAIASSPDGIPSRMARALVLARRGDRVGAESLVDGVLATNEKLPEALVLKGDLRRLAGDADAALPYFDKALAINPNDSNAHIHRALALLAQNKEEQAGKEVDAVLAHSPKSVMGAYLKSLLLLRGNKAAQALDAVRPVEDAITQIPRGLFVLAVIHASNNNMEQSLDYATRFHAAAPDDLPGSKLLANIQFRMGAYDKVIATLAPLRSRFLDDVEVLNMLGSSYLVEGRIKEANEVLSDAVKANPSDTLAQARLAVSRTRQTGTREEGLRELEALAKSNPKNPQFDLALVSSYIASGDYDHAIAAASAMIASQPDLPMPLVVRGSAKLDKGDEAGARADFEAALKKAPDFAPAGIYLAELDIRNNQFDHGRTVLDGILARTPTDLQALLARAQIEVRTNNLSAAGNFLDTAISAHPDEIEPRLQMIRAQLAQGNRENAALAAGDLARALPGNPTAVNIAAQTYLALGKRDEALSLYRQLQAAYPDSPQALQWLGEAYATVGMVNDARAAFSRSVAINQHFVPGWARLADLEGKANGLDAGLVVARKAASLNSDDPAALMLPANLLVSAGKPDEAEDDYKKILEKYPTGAVFEHLFQTVVRRGDRGRARVLADDWLKNHPDDSGVRLVLAEDKLETHEFKAAVADYELLAAKQPRNPLLFNNLAWAYDRLDDPRALVAARRAYDLAPGMPEIIDTYGYLLYRKGEVESGAELMEQAHKAAPRNPSITYHLAKIRADQKQDAEARSLLKDIVASRAPFDEAGEARLLYASLGGQ